VVYWKKRGYGITTTPHAIRQHLFEHPAMRERNDQTLERVTRILERPQSAGAVRGDITLDGLKPSGAGPMPSDLRQ
jgi:hypothetical protein